MEKKVIGFSNSIKHLFNKNKIKIAIFILLILVVVISRFYKLSDTAFFVNDQGRDIKVLYRMFTEKKMTLIGPATSFSGNYGNIYFGPYYYYFLLPFYLISQSPYFMTAVFPILFIISIVLFFSVKELKFHQKLITGLLLTFSWFSLYYTRFLWNLNLAFLLSFVLFSLFLKFKKIIIKHWLMSLIFGLISGMIFQIHYGMLFLYISLLVFFFKNKKNLLLYLSGFILSFFPFLLFDIRHEYVISKNILSYIYSLFTPHNGGLSVYSFFSIFAKIFDYYLFPLTSINNWLKIISALSIYVYVIFFNLRKRKEINLFIALSFIIFLFSFFIFKRSFDYYMACFMIWFYFGLALVIYENLKTILGRSILVCLLILFIGLNSYKYFSLPVNLLGLSKQNKIVTAIKGDLSKSHTKELSIIVFPHRDDVNSLEYLMVLDHYDITIVSKKKYYVCYGKCPDIKEAKVKFYSDENIFIYTNY